MIKIAITTLLIVVISEVSRRSSFVGALLASIPLVSVLAIFWLYVDTNDSAKISALATSIFWLVIPSLAFFVTLPVLLKNGLGFYPSMGISMAATVGCYYLMLVVLNYFGVEL